LSVINKSDYFELGRKVLGFINAGLEVAYRQPGCTVVSQDKTVEPSCEIDALGLLLPQQSAAVLCEAHRLFALNSEKFWRVLSSALSKHLSALLLRNFDILLFKKGKSSFLCTLLDLKSSV